MDNFILRNVGLKTFDGFIFLCTAVVKKNLKAVDCLVTLNMFFGGYLHSAFTAFDKTDKGEVEKKIRRVVNLFHRKQVEKAS